MTVLGFDISEVPTADLMELAASLLEADAKAIDNVKALAEGALGKNGMSSVSTDPNRDLAAALRERAARVRNLEEQ